MRAAIGSTWEGPRGDRFVIEEDHHETGYYVVRVQRSEPGGQKLNERVTLDDNALHKWCKQIEPTP